MNSLALLFQWFWAPLAALGVSVAYFRNTRNERLFERILVSCHGASLAALYLGVLGIHRLGLSRPSFGLPFWALFLLPAALTLAALVRFRGNRAIHFLQLVNLLAALWIFFIGTMAVTGSWL